MRLSIQLIGCLAAALAVPACSGDRTSDTRDDEIPVDASIAAPDAQVLPDAQVTVDARVLPDAGGGDLGLACSLAEVQPMLTCAVQSCADSLTDPSSLLACATINCGVLLLGLSPECAECALALLGGDTAVAATACAPGLPDVPGLPELPELPI